MTGQCASADSEEENVQGKLIDIALKLKTYPEVYLYLIEFLEKKFLSSAQRLPKKQIADMVVACRKSMEFCRGMQHRRNLEEMGEAILGRRGTIDYSD